MCVRVHVCASVDWTVGVCVVLWPNKARGTVAAQARSLSGYLLADCFALPCAVQCPDVSITLHAVTELGRH
jgi:hypothetical protein